MIGSDTVGSFGNYADQIRIYDPLFDALADADLIENLASKNFLRIMRKEGVTLDPDYHYPDDRYTRRSLVPR